VEQCIYIMETIRNIKYFRERAISFGMSSEAWTCINGEQFKQLP
jgi:hypothetical protein